MALTKDQKSLKKWGEQKWRTASGKPSTQGKKATGEAYMPEAKLKRLKSTKAGRQKIANANAVKQRAISKGEQYAKHGIHKGAKYT